MKSIFIISRLQHFFFDNSKHFFGESWSLCVEEWFYFGFPLVYGIGLSLTSRIQINYIFKTAGALLFFIVLISFFRLVTFTINKEINNITLYRLDAIAFGFLARISEQKIRSFLKPITGLTVSILLIIAMAILYLKKSQVAIYPLIYYPLIGIGIALLIIYFANYSFPKWPIHVKKFDTIL